MIEKLTSADGPIFIGISENLNSRNLDTNDLLKVAKSLSDSVLALQLFNPTKIVNEMHLLSACQNAVNAFKGDYMIARGLDVEAAVYASAQHQIGRALELVGVADNLTSVAVVCIDTEENAVQQCMKEIENQIGQLVSPMFPTSINKIESIMKIYGVTKLELKQFTESHNIEEQKEALAKCVISRVSRVAFVS